MFISNTSRVESNYKSQYYVTPVPRIREFIDKVKKDPVLKRKFILKNKRVLVPCAGGDKEHKMSYPTVLRQYTSNIITVDIRKDSKAKIKKNYLDLTLKDHFDNKRFDVIITHPPFYSAVQIIEHALKHVKRGGVVVMLVRTSFLSSIKRKDFLQGNMPNYCFLYNRRLSFIEGKDDPMEYMHAIWIKGRPTNRSIFYLV